MTRAFGDFEPEDAYDASDPPDVRLRLLERVAADLLRPERVHDDRWLLRLANVLRLLAATARDGLT